MKYLKIVLYFPYVVSVRVLVTDRLYLSRHFLVSGFCGMLEIQFYVVRASSHRILHL